jgi:hypothetical protein
MWCLCAKMRVWTVLPTCLPPSPRELLSVMGRFFETLLMWCLFVLCPILAVLGRPGSDLKPGFSLKDASRASEFLFGAYLHRRPVLPVSLASLPDFSR